MRRTALAAAFAAAVLPVAALQAAAAPLDTINRTYTLGCAVNQTDGVSLKSGMLIVRNTTPHMIRKGVSIKVTLQVVAPQGTRPRVETFVAFRDVPAGQTIAFPQRFYAQSCSAKVTLQPNLKAKIDRATR